MSPHKLLINYGVGNLVSILLKQVIKANIRQTDMMCLSPERTYLGGPDVLHMAFLLKMLNLYPMLGKHQTDHIEG